MRLFLVHFPDEFDRTRLPLLMILFDCHPILALFEEKAQLLQHFLLPRLRVFCTGQPFILSMARELIGNPLV